MRVIVDGVETELRLVAKRLVGSLALPTDYQYQPPDNSRAYRFPMPIETFLPVGVKIRYSGHTFVRCAS